MSEVASTAPQTPRGGSPFSRGSVLAILLVGFGAFVAMLYFIGAGDTGGDRSSGAAHASSNAIHGYAGLARLLEANGYEVDKSREQGGLETSDLLILTPPMGTDPEEFAEILQNRQYYGPTLVLLPKWFASRPSGDVVEADRDRVQDDWVQLVAPASPGWTAELPVPYTLEVKSELAQGDRPARWAGLALAGELPKKTYSHAAQDPVHEALVIDPSGRRLAVNVLGEEGSEFYNEAYDLTFVIEPDLMNNYGLADPARAALALSLVEQAGYDDNAVTFDMTLVGFGGSTNLLTLAFQPPFLAATLCLILAMLIVGWRAFLRFGPVAARSQTTSFGKTQLVTNGAGLIVRAGRLRLLAEPYAAMIERKMARTLGLTKPDAQAIDTALRQRLPEEEPFSNRVARLQNASRAGDILSAAQSLNDLASKTRGKSRR